MSKTEIQKNLKKALNGGPILEARSGVTKSLVVILHGYGADGDNLMGLGKAWSHKMPNTTFVAPNAFDICEMGFGYQWFSLEDFSPPVRRKNIMAIQGRMDNLLTSIFAAYPQSVDQIILVGFSQGAMISLHQGIYGAHKLKGIIGYSGGFSIKEDLEPLHAPNILLAHGLDDDIVSADFSREGYDALKNLGCEAELILSPGAAHEITKEGFKAGSIMLKELLYL